MAVKVLLICLLFAGTYGSDLIHNSPQELTYKLPTLPAPVSQVNCGCVIIHDDHEVVASSFGKDNCNNYCNHRGATHYFDQQNHCLCFRNPNTFPCEEFEGQDESVAEVKCVRDHISPTKLSTISQSVLNFLRNAKGFHEEQRQFLDDLQRQSRHIDREGHVELNTVPAADVKPSSTTPRSVADTTFGPAKGAGLAATLIALSLLCILAMGLKAWYNHKDKIRKEEKLKGIRNSIEEGGSLDEERIKPGFNWERIMSK